MDPKSRNRFYSFWTVAIVLCFMLSIFALFFAACTDGAPSGDSGTNTPAYSEPLTETAPAAAN